MTDTLVAVMLHFRTITSSVECLQSLSEAGVRHVVVVDNSQDGGRSMAAGKARIDAMRSSGVRITIVSKGENLGFAKGANLGIRTALSAAAGMILLINSDAKIDEASLSRLRSALQGKEGVAVPGIVKDRSGVHESARYYHALSGLVLKAPAPGAFRYFSGACMLLTAEAARRFTFDESFFFYGEDVEVSVRLFGSEMCCIRVEESEIAHAGAGSARNGSFFYEYHTVRGHWLLGDKLTNGCALRCVAVLLRVVTLSARAVTRSVRTGSPIPLKAFLTASSDVLVGRCRGFTPAA